MTTTELGVRPDGSDVLAAALGPVGPVETIGEPAIVDGLARSASVVEPRMVLRGVAALPLVLFRAVA